MGETYCTTDGIFQIPDLTLIKPTQKEKETAMGRGRLKGGGGGEGATEEKGDERWREVRKKKRRRKKKRSIKGYYSSAN